MQNLSTGKLIAIFVGFLVAVGAAAVFIMKSTAQSGDNTVTVTKKRHRVEQARTDVQAPAAQAQASSASTPTTDQMMGLAPTAATATPQDAASNATPQATQAQSPATNAAVAQPATATAVVNNATASPVVATSNVGCLDKPVAQAPRAKRHKSTAVAKKPAAKTEAADRELARMDGYKTMAVVGHRAWIVGPDGTPDNVAKGEEVHAKPMRVRSVDKESSVVITTTDQYIDAQ